MNRIIIQYVDLSRRSILACGTRRILLVFENAPLFGLLHLLLDVWILVDVGQGVRDGVVHFDLVADDITKCRILPRLLLPRHVFDGGVAQIDDLRLLRAPLEEGLRLQVLELRRLPRITKAPLGLALIQQELIPYLPGIIVDVIAHRPRPLNCLQSRGAISSP